MKTQAVSNQAHGNWDLEVARFRSRHHSSTLSGEPDHTWRSSLQRPLPPIPVISPITPMEPQSAYGYARSSGNGGGGAREARFSARAVEEDYRLQNPFRLPFAPSDRPEMSYGPPAEAQIGQNVRNSENRESENGSSGMVRMPSRLPAEAQQSPLSKPAVSPISPVKRGPRDNRSPSVDEEYHR